MTIDMTNLRYYGRALRYVLKSWAFWLGVLCLPVVAAAVAIAPGSSTRHIIDRMSDDPQASTWAIAGLAGLGFLVAIATAVVNALVGYFIGHAGWWGTYRIREDAMSAISDQALDGDEVSRLVGDAEALQSALLAPLTTGVVSLLSLVGILIVMLWVTWGEVTMLYLIPLSLSIVLIVAIAVKFGGRLRGAVLRAREARGSLVAEAMASDPDTNGTPESFTEANRAFTGRSMGVVVVTVTYGALLSIATAVGAALVPLSWTTFAPLRETTVGTYVMLSMYGGQALGAASAVATAYILMQGASAYARRVFELIDRSDPSPEPQVENE